MAVTRIETGEVVAIEDIENTEAENISVPKAQRSLFLTIGLPKEGK